MSNGKSKKIKSHIATVPIDEDVKTYETPSQPLITGNTQYGLWFIVGITFIASLWGIIVRGAAVEWLLAILTGVLFFTSYILPRLAITHIEIERQMSGHVVDNDEVSIGLTIKRKWSIPGIWYASIERFTNESELKDEGILLQQHYEPFLSRYMKQNYVLEHLRRGQYKSEGVTIVIGDLLGLTTLKRHIAKPLAFSMLPQLLLEQDHTYLSQLTSQKWSLSTMKPELEKTSNQSVRTINQAQEMTVGGFDNGIKPYSEGDSIHRIYYHAMSRGMGVHVSDDEEQLTQIKYVIFIDQYMPPMKLETARQQFNTLIGWTLDRVGKQLSSGEGPIMVVTDNWCYECFELYQLDELRRLLAQLTPDVQYPISERLVSLAKLLPAYSHLMVYTTDWKNSEGWTELSQLAWHKKVTVRLQLLSEQRIMTYTMREQQRELEQTGLQLIWRFSNYTANSPTYARKGVEHYG